MRKKLLLASVTVLALLLGIELALGFKIADGTFRGAPVPPFGVPDEELRAALLRRAKNARTTPGRYGPLTRWSARYGWVGVPGDARREGLSRNSLGARGARDVPATPPEDRLRVLCFGESFTYGAEVADGEDWPTRLEDLEARLEVSNFGVNAWGTDQAYLRFREVAPELAPDVLLLGLLTENICRNVNRYRQMYKPNDALALVKPRFVLADGALELVPIPYPSEVEFLEAAARGDLREDLREHEWWAGDDPVVPFSNLARARAALRAQRRRIPSRLWSDPSGEPYRVTFALLEAFHREALALGGRAAAVVLFQSCADHEFVERTGRAPYWNGLVADLAAHGIPVIDTFPAIAELRARGERAYLDTHHDPAGNDAIAESVLRHLEAVLPELR